MPLDAFLLSSYNILGKFYYIKEFEALKYIPDTFSWANYNPLSLQIATWAYKTKLACLISVCV